MLEIMIRKQIYKKDVSSINIEFLISVESK